MTLLSGLPDLDGLLPDDESLLQAGTETNPTPGSEAAATPPPAETAPTEPTTVTDTTLAGAPESPVEVPTELIPTADHSNVLNDVERQELARLRHERAEVAQFRAEQQSATELQQKQREYESRGMDPETALYIANEVRAERLRGQEQLANSQMQAQIETGRRNAAAYYGKEYGVTPSALVGFPTPESMEAYAKLLAHTGKQEKRLSMVEKNQVQEQHFDGGQGAAGGPKTPSEILAFYGDNPDVEFTTEHKKTLTDAGYGT